MILYIILILLIISIYLVIKKKCYFSNLNNDNKYIKNFFNENGYIILKNILTFKQIDKCKQIIFEYMKKNKLINNSNGYTIPNFIELEDFSYISRLKDNRKIKNILNIIFSGNNYRFCSHNDIGINRIVGWHKDKLNGKYANYEKNDIWKEYNGEKHEIVKVLIYLQDHDKLKDGLKLVPKSHLDKNIKINNYIDVKSKIGDIIIFDQRITHRGMINQVKEPRILISFGFGKNNIFTDNFEKGTILRQNEIKE